MAIKITGTNTAAAPGITGDDTDTGLFYGTNEIGFSTGGTSRLTLDSSGHLKFPDSGKIRLGTGNDLDIFHNSNINYIHSNNAIPLRITTGAETQAVFTANGSVDLYFDNTKRFETKSDGVDITGELQCDSLDVDGAAEFTGADVTFYGASYNSYWDQSANLLKFEDNAKVSFGSGDDFQLSHNGTNSFITNSTGELQFQANDVRFYTSGAAETHAKFINNGAVELYHNNIKTFNTASSGIELRGPEAGNCELYMYADEGDDNADLWKFIVAEGSSSFYLQNKNSGSWETNIIAKGDAEVQLHYDNALQCSTSANGLSFPSGKGIDFSANSHASGMSSELLDGYEEGTWTANILGGSSTGSVSYSSNNCFYTRIGRQVTVSFYINWTSGTGSGHLNVHGLPFTVGPTHNQFAGAVMVHEVDWPNGASTGSNIVTHTWSGINYFRLYTSQDNGAWQAVQCDSAGAIIGTLIYMTD